MNQINLIHFHFSSIRGLSKYLQENGLIRTTKDLSFLSNSNIGIDCHTYLINNKSNISHKLYNCIGNSSIDYLNKYILNENEILFSKNNIHKIIVHGQNDLCPQIINNDDDNNPINDYDIWKYSIQTPDTAIYDLQENTIKDLQIEVQKEQLMHAWKYVKTLSSSSSKTDLIYSPSTSTAQLVTLYKNGIIDAVYSNLDLLLYGIDIIILSLNKDKIEFIRLEDVLNFIEMDYNNFLYCCYLAGRGKCKTFPIFDIVLPEWNIKAIKIDNEQEYKKQLILLSQKWNTSLRYSNKRIFSFDSIINIYHKFNCNIELFFQQQEELIPSNILLKKKKQIMNQILELHNDIITKPVLTFNGIINSSYRPFHILFIYMYNKRYYSNVINK